MSKTVRTVFLLIATLVLIFLIWQLFFTDDGILVTAYNAMAKGINAQFEKATGDGELLPEWNAEDNGQGFTIGTGA